MVTTTDYDGIAVIVIAAQLEAEVPYETVGKLLSHDGWVDLVQTLRTMSPQAFLALCADHQGAIEAAIQETER